jgi:hypothetical protein
VQFSGVSQLGRSTGLEALVQLVRETTAMVQQDQEEAAMAETEAVMTTWKGSCTLQLVRKDRELQYA